MMRTGDSLSSKKWAELFHQYLHGDDAFYAANFGPDNRVSVMRTLAHEEAIWPTEYVEVLDHEKATAIIEDSSRFAIGLCSCRHEKLDAGQIQRREAYWGGIEEIVRTCPLDRREHCAGVLVRRIVRGWH